MSGWDGSTRRERLPADWPQRRAYVLRRDGYRCTVIRADETRCRDRATEVDHIHLGDDHHRCRQYNIDWAGTVPIIVPMAAVATAARTRGQLLAVASNASAINLKASMTATGLAGLFEAVATWSDVEPGRGKPHPDIFLLAATRLSVPPEQCLVYEDAEEGVAGALAAGMTVFNVRTGELSHPTSRAQPQTWPCRTSAIRDPGWS